MHEAFGFHLLNEQGKIKAQQMSNYFDTLLECVKSAGVEGRYLAIVTTKLEEACFFAKKGLASKAENQMKEGA